MSTVDLTIDLPAGLSGDEAKVLLAIKLYEIGKATLGQAARISGYSKRAFMEILGHHEIPVFNYSSEELRQEIGQ